LVYYPQAEPGWTSLCGKVHEELALAKKRPISTRAAGHKTNPNLRPTTYSKKISILAQNESGRQN